MTAACKLNYQATFSAKPVVTMSKTIIGLDIKPKIVAKCIMYFAKF